jgi:hypothetical protein
VGEQGQRKLTARVWREEKGVGNEFVPVQTDKRGRSTRGTDVLASNFDESE